MPQQGACWRAKFYYLPCECGGDCAGVVIVAVWTGSGVAVVGSVGGRQQCLEGVYVEGPAVDLEGCGWVVAWSPVEMG